MKRALVLAAVLALGLLTSLVACQTSTPSADAGGHRGPFAATVGIGLGSPNPLVGDAAAATPTFSGTFGQQRSVIVAITTGTDGAAWSGTVQFQGSADGVTFFPIPCTNMGAVVGTIGVAATQTTANGLWFCNVDGLAAFQAQGVAITGGVANVTVNVSPTTQTFGYSLIDATTGAMVRTAF